jgi:hypothetical protein
MYPHGLRPVIVAPFDLSGGRAKADPHFRNWKWDNLVFADAEMGASITPREAFFEPPAFFKKTKGGDK